MRHLSDGNTTKSGSHQVVDGRRFYLAGSLHIKLPQKEYGTDSQKFMP